MSIVSEEGFGEHVVADRSADRIAEGIAAGIAEGEGRNGFANNEGCTGSEGSVVGGGAHSVCTGSAGRATGATAEIGGSSVVSGESRSVSEGGRSVSGGCLSVSESKGAAEGGGPAGTWKHGFGRGL